MVHEFQESRIAIGASKEPAKYVNHCAFARYSPVEY